MNMQEKVPSQEKPRYEITPATPSDLEAITAVGGDPEDHEYSLELQESGQGQLLVAKNKTGQVIGYATLSHDLQSPHFNAIKGPHIQGVMVDENNRGKGVGDTLLEASAAAVKKIGRSEIFLTVEADNLPAINLYERNGYKKIPNSDCGPDSPEVPGALPAKGFYMRKEV